MRFQVRSYRRTEQDKPYFAVIDNESTRWNSPERAVSLYFANYERARQVAEILNNEWKLFLANPN